MYCPGCINKNDRIKIPTESGIEKTEFIRISNDGGSHACNSCDVLFHYCSNGVKYGSPGPKLCNDCRPPTGGDNDLWVPLSDWWVDSNGEPLNVTSVPTGCIKYHADEKINKPTDV
jgi:hypothetical protein